MTARRLGRGVWFLCGLSAACAESREEALVSRADSAGVEIVTNQRSFAEVPLRTLPDEVARGIADEGLYQITGIQLLSEGRLAVGANGAGSVLLYDEAGVRTATLGRMGDGPGEFRSVGSLVSLPGDSLGVYDPRHHRLTVFPPDAGAPRILNLTEVDQASGWSRVLPLESGLAFVGEAGLGGGTEQGVYRNTATSYRIDRDGQVLATYGDFPGVQAFIGSGAMGRAPFGALLTTATWRDQFVVGTGERPEVRIYGPGGSLARIIRWADTDRTVTRERMNEFVDFMLSQVPPEQTGPMRDLLQGMPYAPQMPAHLEVLVSPEGVMWVGEYPGPEAELPTGRSSVTRQWVVFDPDGIMRERLRTPRGFLPLTLAGDLVWGVHQDELDVESVRAYRIGP